MLQVYNRKHVEAVKRMKGGKGKHIELSFIYVICVSWRCKPLLILLWACVWRAWLFSNVYEQRTILSLSRRISEKRQNLPPSLSLYICNMYTYIHIYTHICIYIYTYIYICILSKFTWNQRGFLVQTIFDSKIMFAVWTCAFATKTSRDIFWSLIEERFTHL